VHEILLWHWFAFLGMVSVLLTLDLFVFHRNDHSPSIRESAGWTIFWCSLALIFNGFIWWWQGSKPAIDFLAGYVIEWSLSVDNVFVFAVIFGFFQIPLKFQYRVLFWGILGAIVMRLLFVLLGGQLLQHFEWMKSIFGLFLVFTAIKLAIKTEGEVHPDKNIILRLARRFFNVSKGGHDEHGHSFFVRENSRFCFTPIFLVLLVVESTDVLFAVDSVPAIFGITHDSFIVFTSNIFAILGLRALYFLLAGMIDYFDYLHYGLSAVLGFVGANMIADWWFQPEVGHCIPTWTKLLIIATLLGISMVVSVFADATGKKRPSDE
jgi:tellurite resistance protein TerC